MSEKSSRFRTFIQCFSKKWRTEVLIALTLAFILASITVALPRQQPAYAASGNWPTYLFDNGRHGFNGAETIINPTSAKNLKVHWTYQAGNVIFTQPVEANGMIYWGSFDGYEHATDLSGKQVWQQNLGQTSPNCGSTGPLGIVSTATVASINIGGTLTSVDFVGGGDSNFYALNASSGAVIWKTSLGAPSSNRFIWSSPVVYNGSVYIAIASIGDCPLVQGQLFQLDAKTGTMQNTFNVVPNGCIGGGIWGSPTIDQGSGSLYFATGNPGSCSTKEPFTVALVKLRASDLAFMSAWQVPSSERTHDSDFGSTPTLFPATIGGSSHQLVGVANKNGIYYTFDRTTISNGPLWRAQIAVGGACPQCGNGSISPSGWDGSRLYVAGGTTTIGGNSCKGSLRALNPATGSFIWEHCMLDGPVIGAVTVVPGVAVVVEGPTLVVVATSSGNTLFSYRGASSSHFYGSASISNGVLYIGNRDQNLYAIGT